MEPSGHRIVVLLVFAGMFAAVVVHAEGLYEAVRDNDIGRVQQLLDQGADPNELGWGQRPVLCAAASADRAQIIEMLLKRGAKPNATGPDGWTALHFAADNGHLEATCALLRGGADPNMRDGEGKTPAQIAVDRQRVDLVQALLDGGAEWTLALAAVVGDAARAERLLGAGADVNARDHRGVAPLHLAAWYGRVDVIGLLVAHGADLAARDTNGLLPLHHAAHAGQADAAETLVKAGADLEGAKYSGATALHCAAYLYRRKDDATRARHADTARRLIALGANVNARTSEGETPLHRAAAAALPDVAQALIDAGADLNAENVAGYAPLDKAGETTSGLLVAAGAKHGMGYALRGDLVRLEELLGAGRSVNERNLSGATLLHRAIDSCRDDVVAFLLERGAEVNAVDDKGLTPLHWLCQGNYWLHSSGEQAQLLATLLIDHGANVNARAANGLTPLAIAKESGMTAVIPVLRKHGARQ